MIQIIYFKITAEIDSLKIKKLDLLNLIKISEYACTLIKLRKKKN